tara:strand:+ start:157 stop:315 length:159 start_codon:yes stop_codon:yes gene_type:complete
MLLPLPPPSPPPTTVAATAAAAVPCKLPMIVRLPPNKQDTLMSGIKYWAIQD